MLLDDITLVGDSASTRMYSLKSVTDGNSIRGASTAPLNAPETLTIKHSVSSRGGIQLDRHLVRLDLTKINGAFQPVVGSVYVNFEVPRDSVFTAAMIKDMKTQMVNLLAVAGNVDKLLAGEP